MAADPRRCVLAGIIREAGRLDTQALEHMEAALVAWDKTHGHYMSS